MFRKIFPFGGGQRPLALEDLLSDGSAPVQRAQVLPRVLIIGGTAVAAVGLGLAALTLGPGAGGALGETLRSIASAAQSTGMGFGTLGLVGLAAAALGTALMRMDRLFDEAQRLADEQPDLRPALEGVGARQRQILSGLGGVQQRVAAMQQELGRALDELTSAPPQSAAAMLDERLMRIEETLIERFDALHAGQPTEALWRLAASLDRLGLELERRIERRLDQHVDGLDERIAALAHSTRSVLAQTTGTARTASPHAPHAAPELHPLAASPAARHAPASAALKVAAAPVKPVAPAVPAAPAAPRAPRSDERLSRAVGSEPSLAAQMRAFAPGDEANEDSLEVLSFDLDCAPAADLYGAIARHPHADDENGGFELDESRIDDDLTTSLGILDQADPFAGDARSRSLGPQPKSGVERRPDPPAPLPRPRSAAAEPTRRALDLGERNSQR